MKSIVKGVLQLALICLFAVVGDGLAAWWQTAIPGSIIGMGLLFVALQLKWIRLEWVDQGGGWLIAQMLLFFIPSAVGVVQYQELVKSDGVRLFLVIVGSTLVVMICTGLCAEWMARWKKGRVRHD